MASSELPESILKSSNAAMKKLLPDKSHYRYIETYNKFNNWRKEHNTESLEEEVFLAYFEESSEGYKPSTLWSMYSMLRGTGISNHNINIANYPRVMSFLKAKNKGFVSKKAAVFLPQDIKRFLLNAPDSEYLVIKAVTVFGISGGCRGDEITHVLFEHVTDAGNEIVVRIPESKTYVSKIFPITSETSIDIIRRYIALRPPNSQTNRCFILQRGNKCVGQAIGKNTIAQMPRKIARFLELDNPESYSGHSFRRTSTTIAADAGASMESLKRFYYWKSNTVAERYIQDSLGQKRQLAATITKALDLEQSGGDIENDGHELGGADEPPHAKIVKTLCDDTIVDLAAINSSTRENGNVRMVMRRFHWCECGIVVNVGSTIALSQSVSNNEKNIERHSIKYFQSKFERRVQHKATKLAM